MRRESITVSDLMSPMPTTIRATRTAEEALEEMRSADVRHLPVVDGALRLVGILSDRDVLRMAGRPEAKEQLVRDVMTEDVAVVSPDSRAYEASALMLDRKVGALPVVGADGRLSGIVTETDFLRVAHRALGGDRMATDDR
jgi:CBS domain-containing protein